MIFKVLFSSSVAIFSHFEPYLKEKSPILSKLWIKELK